MVADLYTIGQFMDALYKKDRSVIKTEEELLQLKNEYIDIAGLYESEEFDKVQYIYYLNGRINSMKMSIFLQRKFIEDFGMPYTPDFSKFEEYGHIVIFNGDLVNFEKRLVDIESIEKTYTSELENSLKELSDLRKNKNKEEVTEQQSRASMIKTINSLGKLGYRISKSETTVEEYSYMIKQESEKE